MNHLRATIFSSYIKDLYEDTALYFAEILEAAAQKGFDHKRLIGEHKITFEANELLSVGSWNAVVRLISQALFRKLETEKSTKELISKVNTKLNLDVAESTIDSALPYFEIRHLLVHCDGKQTDVLLPHSPS